METQVFPRQSLDAITLVGAADIFAGNNEANAWMTQAIGPCKHGNLGRASPGRLVKDLLEFLSGKEPELPTKFQRLQPGQGGRLCVKRESAEHGPWNGDEPEPGGRLWWPCENGSRGYACASARWVGMYVSLPDPLNCSRHSGRRWICLTAASYRPTYKKRRNFIRRLARSQPNTQKILCWRISDTTANSLWVSRKCQSKTAR